MAADLKTILTGGLPAVLEKLQGKPVSYCRFGEGDVYLYRAGGSIECCCCALNGGALIDLPDAVHAYVHLMEHRAAGHAVPERALTRLDFEASGKEYAAWLADRDIRKIAGER